LNLLFARPRLQGQVVLADLDQIAFLHRVPAGDLLAVDADAGEAVQVLDVEIARLAQQTPVLARDVLLRQPHQVLVVAADGDLVAHDGDHRLASLVVFDDQLHGMASRCGNPTAYPGARPKRAVGFPARSGQGVTSR